MASFLDGKAKRNSGADSRMAFDPHIAAMKLNKALADRHAEARTRFSAVKRSVDLAELLENFRQVLGLYANARIFHSDNDIPAPAIGAQRDPAFVRKLGAVAQ